MMYLICFQIELGRWKLKSNTTSLKNSAPLTLAHFMLYLSQVWLSLFPFLRFREASSHAQCTECLLHQSLLSSFSKWISARVAQTALFENHLKAQYLDRVLYWESRAQSRLREGELVLIQDGMDQAKFSCPRHPALRAKSLEGLVAARPRLHVTGVLVHGHAMLFALSEANVAKDSNSSIELLSHALTLVQRQGHDLSKFRVTVQCDNTCRELKNNQCMRYLAALVSNKVVRAARIRNLRSGHSHEDIDQIFGTCAKSIVASCNKAESSADFLRHLQEFVTALPRTYEEGRYAVRLERARDWRLAYSQRLRSCRYDFDSIDSSSWKTSASL